MCKCKDLCKEYKTREPIIERKIDYILDYFMRINNLEYLKRSLYHSKDEDVDLIYLIVQRCIGDELRELDPYFRAKRELDEYREYLSKKYGEIKINEVYSWTKEEEAKFHKLHKAVVLLHPYDDYIYNNPTFNNKYHVNNRSDINDETIKNTKI